MTKYNNLLLSPDGVEASLVNDPFSVAASQVEAPKFPILAGDRICRFTIAKCSKAPSKDNASRETLTIVIKTTQDYPDTDGKPLRAGFTGYKRIGITPVTEAEAGEKRPRDIKAIIADLAMVLKACGKGDLLVSELVNNPAIVEGQTVDMKVGVQPEKGGYPASNSFTFVLPA